VLRAYKYLCVRMYSNNNPVAKEKTIIYGRSQSGVRVIHAYYTPIGPSKLLNILLATARCITRLSLSRGWHLCILYVYIYIYVILE